MRMSRKIGISIPKWSDFNFVAQPRDSDDVYIFQSQNGLILTADVTDFEALSSGHFNPKMV